MEGLIENNVFLIDGERIVIDEKALNDARLPAKIEERVKNSIPFLFVKNKRIYFESQAVSVVNNRILTDNSVIRGKFLDRNAFVLAETILDRVTGKQTRAYP